MSEQLVRMAIYAAFRAALRWGVGLQDVCAVNARPGDGRAARAWGAEAWGRSGESAMVTPYAGPAETLGALADNDVKEGA